MKIEFGKYEPYHSGWQGWKGAVDVYVDGALVGVIEGDGPNRAKMDFGFRATASTDLTAAIAMKWPRLVLPVGINAAKAKFKELAEKLAEVP